MKLLEKRYFLTTEFDDTEESQKQLHEAIDEINELGINFQLEQTNSLRIGFWWFHRRYSVLGDIILIGGSIFGAILLWWYR